MLLGSLAIICYLPFIGVMKLVLIGLCVLYSVSILRKQRQYQFIRHNKEGWWLRSADEEYKIEIVGDSTVTIFVTVLRFIVTGKKFKQSCVIFKDAMDGDTYRKMIVRLRYF